MGRPRKPSNILEMRGAFKKNPQRKKARAGEPKDARGIGSPPRGLTKEVRSAWREIVECAVPGVLTRADRPAVLSAAHLYARMKDQRGTHERRRQELLDQLEGLADPSGAPGLRDLLVEIVEFIDQCPQWRAADMANLRALLGSLGMTPADRSRVSVAVEKTKPDNVFLED